MTGPAPFLVFKRKGSQVNRVWRRVLFLMLATAFFAGVAHAQGEEASSTTSVSQENRRGHVLFLVTRNGDPAEGIEIQGDFGARRTDAEGVVSLELPQGRHQVRVGELEESFSFEVHEGAETQAIVRLHDVKEAQFEELAPRLDEAAPEISQAEGKTWRVRVLVEGSDRPVVSALVLVSGFRGQLETDSDGWVRFRGPSETGQVLISHPAFEAKTVALRSAGFGDEVIVRMKETSGDLEEVVVLAPRNRASVAALIEIRRQTNAVAEVLGAEQMSRQGDSDAASSLRRVTGLSLVGGKYVYIRGLGERYSSVQLNALGLPSPEPAKRVVPLDLFPTAVLESVLVQKSYSADMPGEFGGGLIQLKTRSLPDRGFFRLSLSQTLDDVPDRLADPQGQGDWMGQGGDHRRLPGIVREALGSGRRLNENTPPVFVNGFEAEELQVLGRSFDQNYSPGRDSSALPPGLTVAAGGRWRMNGGWSLGAAGSLLTSSSSDQSEKRSARFNVGGGNELVRSEDARSEESEVERRAGMTLDVGVDFGENHRLVASALAVRDSQGRVEIKDSVGFGDSVDGRRKTSIEWIERELFLRQLQGSHRWAALSGLQLDWRGGVAEARRESPDAREYVYLLQGGDYTFNTDTTGNRRVFSELSDESNQVAFDLTLPLEGIRWAGRSFGDLKIKSGYDLFRKTRESDVFRFHFKNRFPVGQGPDLRAPPDVILGEGNIRPDGFVVTNLTDSADSYAASQRTEAVFGQLEWSPSARWTLVSGVRREISQQEVRTFFYDRRDSPDSLAGLRTDDFLPGHSLTWKPSESWRARFAYSETLARPDFRELSTVPFIDDESGLEVVGNSRLRGTVIKNFDHRWEYYFNPDEFLSAGFFLKEFDSPIEEVFEPSPNLRKSFDNADRAINSGVEIEARFGLRRLSRHLRFWTHAVNVSVIDSRITLSEGNQGVQTTSDRPLQGQSPYVLNLQFQYDRPSRGTTATVLYNVIGPRITEVGTNLRPDVYEQPFQQLDVVASQKFGKNTSGGIRIRNLLDPEAVSLQGGEVVRRSKKGSSVSVGLTVTL